MVGVQSEDLVEAVIDIERLVNYTRSPLPMRAGIARGLVLFIDGDDHVGRTVILASRLRDRAKPREILAQVGTVNLKMVNAEAAPLSCHEIPGFVEPLDLVRRTPVGGY